MTFHMVKDYLFQPMEAAMKVSFLLVNVMAKEF